MVARSLLDAKNGCLAAKSPAQAHLLGVYCALLDEPSPHTHLVARRRSPSIRLLHLLQQLLPESSVPLLPPPGWEAPPPMSRARRRSLSVYAMLLWSAWLAQSGSQVVLLRPPGDHTFIGGAPPFRAHPCCPSDSQSWRERASAFAATISHLIVRHQWRERLFLG